MGIALAIVLGAFVVAHGAIVVGLAQRRAWMRALVALAVPPLAVWWGWKEGLHLRTMAWGAALALYTIGVVVS